MQVLNTHKKAFKIMKRFHYLDHSLGPLIILTGILNAVVAFIPIIFSKYILSAVKNGQYREAVYYVVGMSLTFCIGCVAADWLKKVVSDRSIRVSNEIEGLIHQKPLNLDYQSMEDGKAIESYTSAISALNYKASYSQMFKQYLELIQNIIQLFMGLGLTIDLCLRWGKSGDAILDVVSNPFVSGLILIVVVFGTMGVTNKIVKWGKVRISELFENKLDCEKKFGYLCRMFRDDEMVKTMQSYDAGESINTLLNDTSLFIRNTYKKESAYWIYGSLASTTASSIIVVTSYALVALKILSGAIGFGGFLMYSNAVIKMNESLLAAIVLNNEITDMMRYMDKLTELLDMENKFETGSIPVEKRSDHKYKLCFQDVWFKYPGSEEYVLKGVNCEINSNIKSALVGPNGAGKSTFIKLLSRLYEPTRGRITLNGVDIKKYDYKEYLSLFSVVFQDFGLFSFGLGENIASSVDVDNEKIERCLHKTGLDKYVTRLNESMKEMNEVEAFNGSDGTLNEKYSGGEQQKIAISRALYKDGPFVILDEPTAALDPLSEFEIYQKFDSLVEDKTCIYISHRMSSCRFCLDIIVLNEGQIVERGNHEDLIENGELYSKMWNAQSKYYTVA